LSTFTATKIASGHHVVAVFDGVDGALTGSFTIIGAIVSDSPAAKINSKQPAKRAGRPDSDPLLRLIQRRNDECQKHFFATELLFAGEMKDAVIAIFSVFAVSPVFSEWSLS
jgi:hypothetical protein